jgi:tRNA (guanine6-N2)-methyltransferase
MDPARVSSQVSLDRDVADAVHLESLPGVVDRLLQQCHDLGAPLLTGIKRVDDSVTLDHRGPLQPVAELRMYSALSVVLGGYEENRANDYADALAALRESLAHGVLSAIEADAGPTDAAPTGTAPADTATTFRIDPLTDRWKLRDLLVEELGWRNDPQSWQVNVTRRGDLLLAQVGPLYHSARFPAMRRVPASTNPLIAALLVQFAKPAPGDVFLDPFCGAGTILIEAAARGQDLAILGGDRSPDALRAADANRPLFPGGHLFGADAAALPLGPDSVDRVVSNIPFGKRIGSHGENLGLYPGFLHELNRVLRLDGRAVLMTDDKNLLRSSIEHTRGLRLVREVKLSTGGLHPSAFILERTRAARRTGRAVSPPTRRSVPPKRPRPSGPPERQAPAAR